MSEESTTPEQPSINQDKLQTLLAEMELQQNLPMGVIAAAVAAIIGAALWAVVTVLTQYQIGFMAIGVGLLVGFAVKYFGKGITPLYSFIGAGFSLLGCLLGNLLSIVGFIGIEEEMSYFSVLSSLDYTAIPDVMVATFQPMDLLFYGLAIYQGYKISLNTLSEEQLASVMDK
ncbi:MAG: hypothetical protein AAF571_00310 [Verrucomicrobiota bacterium]